MHTHGLGSDAGASILNWQMHCQWAVWCNSIHCRISSVLQSLERRNRQKQPNDPTLKPARTASQPIHRKKSILSQLSRSRSRSIDYNNRSQHLAFFISSSPHPPSVPYQTNIPPPSTVQYVSPPPQSPPPQNPPPPTNQPTIHPIPPSPFNSSPL